MNKIFLDANIVIDYLDNSAKGHSAAKDSIRIIRKHFGKPMVSPVTFIITNFILGKFVKDQSWPRKQMELTFSEFEITPLQPSFINAIFKTHFIDLEDGLQYRCAFNAKASVIITKDIKDYFDSKIPVFHPDDFVG